jgi:peroxiredoxin Q/BCP
MLEVGTPAPDFTLPDQDGDEVRLSDELGHWIVLWWYPKAATPG